MLRSFSIILAATIAMAGVAEADHRWRRGDRALSLQIGPVQFYGGPAPRVWVNRRGDRFRRSIAPAFEFDDGFGVPVFLGRDGLTQNERERAALLDRELGRALEALRQGLVPDGDVPVTRGLPGSDGIAVTRLPEAGARPAAPGVIIEEAEVLGPPPPAPAAPELVAPVTQVGTASADDVEHYGVAAFAPLTHPDALGLPRLESGRYYVLNGKVVTLDAEAERALTVAALSEALR